MQGTCFGIGVDPKDGLLTQGEQVSRGLWSPLSEAGNGSVSEVFDAEPPFTPRGCMAQAWGVAEVQRCLVLTKRGA